MKTWMLSVAGTAVWLAACSDRTFAPSETALGVAPSFSAGGQAACPAAAGVVVTTEGELLAALAAASPGATIAVDGTITVTADVNITTPGITLTCASAGSGLVAQAGAGVVGMVNALAGGVTVDRLVLDGSNAETPYFAGGAPGARFTNNRAICGVGGECAFFGGDTPGAVVSDNEFDSPGSFTGVHLQAGIDSSRIERNTINTTVPSTAFGFGGIRVRDGTNVVVAGNVVVGPWSNSIATTNLTLSHFKSNRLEGAVVNGIRFNVGPLLMSDNVFQNNVVTGAGTGGIFAQSACRNLFLGNNLEGNAGNLGAEFAATTGANTLVGNRTVVVDNGAFDCDGDGVNDPNRITGPGFARRGVPGGPPDGSSLVVTRRGIALR